MTTFDARANLSDLTTTAERVRRSVENVIEGKPEVVRIALTVLLAEGHLLIEDVPGVGKTMLSKALARSIDCSVRRIQFTPDLLPSDITGVSVFDQQRAGLRVQAGRDLRPDRGRRRDQPRLAQDAVRAAGVDGGAPGHRRRHQLRTAQPLHGDRHPEPGGDGGHLPAARGAAGPVHRPGVHRLPQPRRRVEDARRARRRLPAGRPAAGRARPRDRQTHRGRTAGARRRPGAAVRGGAGRRHPQPPRPAARRLAAGHPAPGARGPRVRGAGRPGLRTPRRRAVAGVLGAGAPPAAHRAGAVEPAHPRAGGRRDRAAGAGARSHRRATGRSARPGARRACPTHGGL